MFACKYERIEKHEAVCQAIPGRDIDRSVGDILLDMMRPETIELTFAVQREIRERQNEVETLRRKKVERATYESDLARERFMRVDPNNMIFDPSFNKSMHFIIKKFIPLTRIIPLLEF